jgi:predicted Fe-Mo cluster-binding NifX family protein
MKIVIPLNNDLNFYHDNPITAPRFAIYTIEIKRSYVRTSLEHIIENPWNRTNNGKYEASQIQCACDQDRCADLAHISEHYFLLDSIGGCDYLLADHYCENIHRALVNGGITIYKIPPFIHQSDYAIKNFLLGASLANTIQNIHHAS